MTCKRCERLEKLIKEHADRANSALSDLTKHGHGAPHTAGAAMGLNALAHEVFGEGVCDDDEAWARRNSAEED